MTKIEVILICDKIEGIQSVDGHMPAGKVNLIGLFDTIKAAGFPAVHNSVSVFVRLITDPGEHMEHYRVLNPDGGIVYTSAKRSLVGKGGKYQIAHILNKIPLDKEGEYSIEIYVDEKMAGSVKFFAEKDE